MKVAVLADIHANVVALEAVLHDARAAGVERLVLLGDYVGYYYQPAEVIAMLRSWPCDAILGNHDRFALASRTDRHILDNYRNRYGTALDVLHESLQPEDWAWLESLPLQRNICMGGRTIHLAHGATFDDDAYIYPDADEDLLEQVRGELEVDSIWLGHTHWPFCTSGKPNIANPGSVGQPRDFGGAASWMLYHSETGALAFRRTEFDVEQLQRDCAIRDPAQARNRDVLRRRRLGKLNQ